MPENDSEVGCFRTFAAHVVPFAVFGLLTCIGPLLNMPAGLLYTVKTVLTAYALYFFRNDFKSEIVPVWSWPAVLAGVFVFFIWVLPDDLYPHLGSSSFNPYETGMNVYFVMTIRLAGAALVVPVMEELFWRSFALRFVVHSDFKSIPLGTFSWFSFIAVSIAFGFEHQQWLVGIVAGMVYAWTLYRRKNLFEPILAHGVTNLMLGIYVIQTGKWGFW